MASRIPQAPEAEAAVLGAVMLRNSAFDENNVSDLQPDDFHLPKHSVVWGAMRTLLHAGHVVDIVTVEEQLRSTEEIGLAGGIEALAKLGDRVAVTTNVSEHARLVAAKARARRAQRIMAEAQDRLAALDVDELDDFIAETQGRLAEVEAGSGDGLLSLGAVVDAAGKEARERAEGTLEPFSWGLQMLDDIFDGGVLPGELVIVAGRPGMGKTVLGMGVVFESAQRGEVPLVFSLEMRPGQLGRRAIAYQGELSLKDAKHPTTDRAWSKLIEAREHYAKLGGKVWPRRIHLDRMLGVARAWRRKTRNPGPLVIDYLQLLEVTGRGRIDKRERIEIITRELKLLAMELEVPVILLSQLNRALEARDDKRPRLSDLRDSGSIEQDADSVVFLYRPRVYDSKHERPREAECIVAKCREGVPGTAYVEFEGHFSRFLNNTDAIDRAAPGMEYRS